MVIDEKPNAEGVVYPDRDKPVVSEGVTCQEVSFMIGDRYARCGNRPLP